MKQGLAKSNSSKSLSSESPAFDTSKEALSLDTLSSRVLIPHVLNIFVAENMENIRWIVLEKYFELWKQLHDFDRKMVLGGRFNHIL